MGDINKKRMDFEMKPPISETCHDQLLLPSAIVPTNTTDTNIQKLLEAVENNDEQKLEEIQNLDMDYLHTLMHHKFLHPYYGNILQVACSEKLIEIIEPPIIDTLLKLGADRYTFTSPRNPFPAWFRAAASGRPEILKIFLDSFDKERIDDVRHNNTALIWAIAECKKFKDKSPALECIKLLVKMGINVNKTNARNETAILLCAKNGYKDIIHWFINESGKDIDLDTQKSDGKSAREIIQEKKLYEGTLPEKYIATYNSVKEELDDLLKNRKEAEFISCMNKDNNQNNLKEMANYDNGSDTYLQYCCKHNLKEISSHLLKNGADPNKVITEKTLTPIQIAAELGNYEICEHLLQCKNTKVRDDLLHSLILGLTRTKGDREKYKDFLYKLLKQGKWSNDARINYNARNDSGSTPLLLACRYGTEELVLQLLCNGASLACKDKFEQMPIGSINAQTLQKHLDNCMENPENESDLKPNDGITYNYKNLVPPEEEGTINGENQKDKDVEHQKTKQEFNPEMDVVMYMAESFELKELLQHPVISSFLFMKWRRIKRIFYWNLGLYLIFCLFLVGHIIYFHEYWEAQPILKFGTCSLWVLLFIRELFQIVVAFKLYIQKFENFIEFTLLVVTIFTLLLNDPEEDTWKQLSSVATLLAAIALTLQIGLLPFMAENVTMLRTVSINFLKLLGGYAILIMAFAFSFYTLFTKLPHSQNYPKVVPNQPQEGTEEDKDSFQDPVETIFKTIIMLTGEFDAGDIRFANYPLVSRAVYILFVFLIAVVVFNLLNGLAVSDTQSIRSDAQLVTQIVRARHVAYYERVLTGEYLLPLQNVINNFKKYIFRSKDKTKSFRFLRQICLFPEYLPRYNLTVILSNNKCEVNEKRNRSNSSGMLDASRTIQQNERIYLDENTFNVTQSWIKKNKSVDVVEAKLNEILKILHKQKENGRM